MDFFGSVHQESHGGHILWCSRNNIDVLARIFHKVFTKVFSCSIQPNGSDCIEVVTSISWVRTSGVCRNIFSHLDSRNFINNSNAWKIIGLAIIFRRDSLRRCRVDVVSIERNRKSLRLPISAFTSFPARGLDNISNTSCHSHLFHAGDQWLLWRGCTSLGR